MNASTAWQAGSGPVVPAWADALVALGPHAVERWFEWPLAPRHAAPMRIVTTGRAFAGLFGSGQADARPAGAGPVDGAAPWLGHTDAGGGR